MADLMDPLVLEDGCSWPSVAKSGHLEWKLRYHPGERPVELAAAQVLAAYRHLLDPHHTTEDSVRKLRALRRAERERRRRGDA